MTKRVLLIVSLLASALAFIGLPHANAETPVCGAGTNGAARLGSDPAGDTTYAGEDVSGASDSQEDLRFVDATADAEAVTFAIGVEDLTDADPPASSGITFSLDINTDKGVFTVNADRSVAQANPGSATVNGNDATATFDSATDVITVTAPASALPADSSTIGLSTAESRADGGAVLAPLTDTATGDCTYEFGLPSATAPFDPTAATVTVIDTGIEASNPEFSYDENVAGPNGQLVGWWDFSGTTSHAACGDATTVWCQTHGPYDPDAESSHGTGTTGMAAGTNASGAKTMSACPGCNLAVAKVLNEDPDPSDPQGGDSGLDGDMASAIRWAVDVVHTDVISVSIGAAAPIPEAVLHDTYVAQRYAREHGVLVLFANGNGWGNAGVPGQPGGFMNYGNSVDVLSVGANGLDGFLVTTDPEVTGPFTVVTSASQAADTDGTADGYHEISGTSFSTPFTAGLATHLIASGRLCGAEDLSPAFVEQLVKDTAVDDVTVPPTFEGYGEVSLTTLDTALGVLCNGAARPDVDPVTKAYVDQVSGTERQVSSDETVGNALFGGGGSAGPTIVRLSDTESTPGVIGLSLPTLADTEIYEVTLAPGASLDDTFGYVGDTSTQPDFDVYLFKAGGAYDSTTFLKSAATGAGEAEHLTYTNAGLTPLKVRVVVTGYTIIADQAFSITGTTLGAPVDEGHAAVQVPVS